MRKSFSCSWTPSTSSLISPRSICPSSRFSNCPTSRFFWGARSSNYAFFERRSVMSRGCSIERSWSEAAVFRATRNNLQTAGRSTTRTEFHSITRTACHSVKMISSVVRTTIRFAIQPTDRLVIRMTSHLVTRILSRLITWMAYTIFRPVPSNLPIQTAFTYRMSRRNRATGIHWSIDSARLPYWRESAWSTF